MTLTLKNLVNNIQKCKTENFNIINTPFTQKTRLDVMKEEIEKTYKNIIEKDNGDTTVPHSDNIANNDNIQKGQKEQESQGGNINSQKPQKTWVESNILIYEEYKYIEFPRNINAIGLKNKANTVNLYGIKNPHSLHKSLYYLQFNEFLLYTTNEKLNKVLNYKRNLEIVLNIADDTNLFTYMTKIATHINTNIYVYNYSNNIPTIYYAPNNCPDVYCMLLYEDIYIPFHNIENSNNKFNICDFIPIENKPANILFDEIINTYTLDVLNLEKSLHTKKVNELFEIAALLKIETTTMVNGKAKKKLKNTIIDDIYACFTK